MPRLAAGVLSKVFDINIKGVSSRRRCALDNIQGPERMSGSCCLASQTTAHKLLVSITIGLIMVVFKCDPNTLQYPISSMAWQNLFGPAGAVNSSGLHFWGVCTLCRRFSKVQSVLVLLVLPHSAQGPGHGHRVVSEPDPRKIGRRVWEIGWGGSVHCTRNAGALPIDS